MANELTLQAVEKKIITLRNEKVILDSDVAELYGVETKHVNQAASNNPDKFPEGYVLTLTKKGWTDLRSNFLTANNVFFGKCYTKLSTILLYYFF